MNGPCSAFSYGWRPLRRSVAPGRKWVGAWVVLVHDSQGGSALVVAQQLSSTPAVDVTKLLESAHLDNMPFHLLPDQEVWQQMKAATAAAHAAGQKPFSYVDLTHRSLLPAWLPAEAVGGKLSLPGSQEWSLGTEDAGSIAQLQRALQSMAAGPRFFRSLPQWASAFMRFGLAAVGTQQWTWAQILSHQDTVYQVAESEAMQGGTPLTAVLYDDMVRKQWASRAKKCDPSFDLSALVVKVDVAVLAMAKARIQAVMQMAATKVTTPAVPPGGGQAASASEAESILSRQSAAVDTLARRAAEATKQMQRQSDAFRGNWQHDWGSGNGQ